MRIQPISKSGKFLRGTHYQVLQNDKTTLTEPQGVQSEGSWQNVTFEALDKDGKAVAITLGVLEFEALKAWFDQAPPLKGKRGIVWK